MIIGLSFAFLAGVLSIFYGVVFKNFGGKYDFKNTMLVYTLFNTLVCLVLSFCMIGTWTSYARLPALLSLVAGAVNISGLIALKKAMSIGNAGVAWTFCQSGLLGPFLFSIVVYGERPSILQYVGAFLIVIGLVLLSGKDRENSSEKSNNTFLYIICVLTTFFFSCIYGSLGVAISKIAPDFSIIIRSLCCYAGTFIMVFILRVAEKSYAVKFHQGLMKSVLSLSFFGIGSVTMLFAALNYLANVNLSGIAIPLLQGIAISGFALYSIFIFKEKSSPVKWCGIVAIILGIIFMSL